MAYFNNFPHARTYDSDLGWLIRTTKEIANEMESFIGFEEEIRQGFEELAEKVAQWGEEFEQFEARVLLEIEQQNNEIERQFLQIKADIAAQMVDYLIDINRQIQAVRAYTEAENLMTRAYVDSIIAEFIASIPDLTTIQIENPVRYRELTSVQIAIDDLYDLIVRENALTAYEYDTAQLSADQYDALNLTAQEYDYNGSLYIFGGVNPSNLSYMMSPITGEWLPVREVVIQLARFHLPGITASDYDALNLSAAIYDAKNITAYDFDSAGVTP